MATFSISAMAAQCGVTTANIRSWERYGLLQPTKDEVGNRFYCIEDAIRIQHIIDALSKGFSLKEIKPALYGEETHCRSGWLFYQEEECILYAVVFNCHLMYTPDVVCP